MKNDPWFQFTLNNWSQPDQSLPFLKMLLHPSMYFSMSPTTFFILSDSSKYLYFLQVLPCSKHLLIELSTKNSFSQSCKITYLRNMEWIAAQLKFNCLLGKSKIWCTNEFSFCYTFPICHKWIFMSFHIGWSESGGQRRKFTFRRLAKTIFPDQSLLRRRLSMADYERREASTSSVAPTPCPSPPACLRDIRTHSLFIFGSSLFSWCCIFFEVWLFHFPLFFPHHLARIWKGESNIGNS